MELLEDADGMVRDSARHAVVELFQYVDNRGKIFNAYSLAGMPPTPQSPTSKSR